MNDDLRQAAFTFALCHLDRADVIEARIANKLEALGAFPDARFLLVDNGSSDGSHAIFEDLAKREPRFTWVLEPRRGIYYTRRRAILEAKGDFVVMVDDDVMLNNDDIAELLEPLVTNPSVGLVGARVRLDSDGRRPNWIHAKLMNQFATDIPYPQQDRYTPAAFPCFPTGVAKAMRLGPEAALFCAAPRVDDYPLGRRRADPVSGVPAQDVGGEDIDLSEIFARNGHGVWFANHAHVVLDVPDERLNPAWFRARFAADGRTRIRVLRRTGRSALSRHGYKFLLGLVPLAGAWVLSPLLPPARRHLIACYLAKSLGAWAEVLTAPRAPPWPYELPKP